MLNSIQLATLKPGLFFSLRLSRREKQSSAKKREHNANRLSVDMHEDLSSSTSNEPKSEEVETVEIVKLSDKQKDILRGTWKTIYGELGKYLKEIDFFSFVGEIETFFSISSRTNSLLRWLQSRRPKQSRPGRRNVFASF